MSRAEQIALWIKAQKAPNPSGLSRGNPGKADDETRADAGSIQVIRVFHVFSPSHTHTRNSARTHAHAVDASRTERRNNLDNLDCLDGGSKSAGLAEGGTRIEGGLPGPAHPSLGMNHCRHCGERINWATDGTAFAGGNAAHNKCYEEHESERQRKRASTAEDGR